MSNKLFRDDPVRFLALEFVKTHTIKRSVPINLYDDEDTKRLLLMVGAENDHMPAVVRDMSSKAVRPQKNSHSRSFVLRSHAHEYYYCNGLPNY